MLSNNEIYESYLSASQNYIKRYKSKHWESEYDNREVEYTIDNLENFRNNSLTDGLNRSIGTNNDFIKNHFNDLLDKCGKEFVLKNLSKNNIGNNQNFIKMNDQYIEVSDNFHINFLFDLENYVFKDDINVICEIGGGYGNLSKLIKNNHPNTTIILIDLPEANFFSSYFLQNNFPDAKILIYNNTNKKDISNEDIRQYDFIVIPPWIGFKDEITIDLFINTRSFMEMDYTVVNEYFDLIQKHISLGGYFFNVNRYHKDTVGHPIEFDNYPYDEKWEVVLSQPSWKQESKIHELITKRTAEKNETISKELQHIKNLKISYFKRKKVNFIVKYIPFLPKLLKVILPYAVINMIKRKLIITK